MKAIQTLLFEEQKRIARQVIDMLPTKGGCVALLGELRMGKTVILKSVNEILTNARDPYREPVLFVSINEISSEDMFFDALIQQVAQKNESLAIMLNIQTFASSWEQFKEITKQLSNHLYSITIILDDTDYLEKNMWGAKVFRRLSSLTNNNIPINFILAGTERLKLWAEQLPNKKGIWEYLSQPPVSLKSISPQQIRDAFPNQTDIPERIIEICGGHPYCLSRFTKDLSDDEQSQILFEAFDLNLRQLQQANEWNETFRHYWTSYPLLSRQICYLLANNLLGLKQDELRRSLEMQKSKDSDVEFALDILERTGILIKRQGTGQYRLIDIFRCWYQNEMGFIANISSPILNHIIHKQNITEREKPITELLFLPEEETVLVKRDHFFFSTKLGMKSNELSIYTKKCDRVPSKKASDFREKLNELGHDLWVAFRNTEWLLEIQRSSEERHRVRVYFPTEMMGFPFELLPIDDTGTRRLGTQAPISRQLFGQGRYVNREPLSLPLAKDKRLKILIISAELNDTAWVGLDGKVQIGKPRYTEIDGFQLDPLRLEDEIYALYQTFNKIPDLVDDITIMSHQVIQGNIIHHEYPTAEAFERLLTEKQFDLLHFAGHGLFTERQKGLVFTDRLVPLNKLDGLLKKQEQLRFVYLSCCESSQMETDEFSNNLLGLAQTCLEAGVPSVLSMRWRISVGVSKRLTEAFYPAFFRSGALDQAMFEAVKQLAQDSSDFSIYASAPVLLVH